VRRFVEVHRSNEEALRAYVPTPCGVPLALFRARELQAELNRSAAGHETDPTLGWAALAAGTLEVHEVPGNHITMLARPHVETLATLLRQCLARGDASTDAGTVRAREEAACPA
jgi:thioesterase domain-containing protein